MKVSQYDYYYKHKYAWKILFYLFIFSTFGVEECNSNNNKLYYQFTLMVFFAQLVQNFEFYINLKKFRKKRPQKYILPRGSKDLSMTLPPSYVGQLRVYCNIL